MKSERVRVTKLEGPKDSREQLVIDVREGLTAAPKWLPPRYFYDEHGSKLFEEITHLPEYYLTRAETSILESIAEPVVDTVQPHEMLELGSGSSRKTRLLLEAMHGRGTGCRYAALDVSESALREAGAALVDACPWIEFEGYLGNFEEHLPLVPRKGTRLLLFLGSTIGNLVEEYRPTFFGTVAATLETSDYFLLGVDLVKDPAVLEAAYNDEAGVTRAFNTNLLKNLNRELDGDFPLDAFEHVARWVPERSRIESSLRAKRPVDVHLPRAGVRLAFAAGEELLTEVSCKFTRESITAELAAAGLAVRRWDLDERGYFAVLLAERDG